VSSFGASIKAVPAPSFNDLAGFHWHVYEVQEEVKIKLENLSLSQEVVRPSLLLSFTSFARKLIDL
jgi:hypothetical protein